VKPDKVIGHPGRERFRQDARALLIFTELGCTKRAARALLSCLLSSCFFAFLVSA
jgi:hypothetical protein